MDSAKLADLSVGFERWSERSPRTYTLAAALFTLLGILVPIAATFGTVGVIVAIMIFTHALAALFFLKFIWVLMVPIVAAFRSVFTAPPRMPGLRIERSDSPALFDLLDRLRDEARAPRLRGVYLVDRYAVGVSNRVRFGSFGLSEWNLIIGLPVILGLEGRHLESILTHEFGHITRRNNGFDSYVYGMRRVQFELRAALEHKPTRLLRVLGPFFRWYAPRFFALSRVIGRRMEVRADRHAAERAGALVFAEALVALDVQDMRLDRDFWAGIERDMMVRPEPPSDLFDRMSSVLRAPAPDAERFVDVALARTPAFYDTHPTLRNRLAALDVSSEDAVRFIRCGDLASETNAAEAFFGSKLPELVHSMNVEWATNVSESWREGFGRTRKLRLALERLDANAAEGLLSLQDRGERAMIAARLLRSDARILLEDVRVDDPENAGVLFALGQVALVLESDPAGLVFLESAVRLDAEALEPAAEIGSRYLLSHATVPEIAAFRDRLENARVQDGHDRPDGKGA